MFDLEPDKDGEPQLFGNAMAEVAQIIANPNRRHTVRRTSSDEKRGPVPRAAVLYRDGYRCAICGSNGALEVDHIIPWSAGGSDCMDNLRTLCQRCNQERSNFRIPADLTPRLPSGSECVHCNPELLTYEDAGLVPVFCLSCLRKAPGVTL